MKLFTLLVVSSLLSSVISVVAQGAAERTNQIPGVSISFLGFTNTGPPQARTATLSPVTNQSIFGPRLSTLAAPTNILVRSPGGPAAMFELSNASPQTVIGNVQSLEYRTPVGWRAVTVPTTGTAALIPPKSAVTSIIPVNATNTQWRITVFCVEQATGVARMIERGKEFGNQVLTGAKTENFSGRKYMVTNSESMK